MKTQHLQDAAVCRDVRSDHCLLDQIRWRSCRRTSMFILVSGVTSTSGRRVKPPVLIDSLARMKCCREEATVQRRVVCVWGAARRAAGRLRRVCPFAFGPTRLFHLTSPCYFSVDHGGKPTSGQPSFLSVVMQRISAVVSLLLSSF